MNMDEALKEFKKNPESPWQQGPTLEAAVDAFLIDNCVNIAG